MTTKSDLEIQERDLLDELGRVRAIINEYPTIRERIAADLVRLKLELRSLERTYAGAPKRLQDAMIKLGEVRALKAAVAKNPKILKYLELKEQLRLAQEEVYKAKENS